MTDRLFISGYYGNENALYTLCNRRGSNLGEFPVGHVGVHHARTKCLFAQLLAVEIELE